MDNSEIKALIRLLDDPDEAVYKNVWNRLVSAGDVALPLLEASLGLTDNVLLNHRIQQLLTEIQNIEFYNGFENWVKSEDRQALIYGLHYVNQLYYPDTDFNQLKARFDELRKSVWLEMNDNLTGFEAIKTLNYFVFELNGLRVETKQSGEKSAQFLDTLFLQKQSSPFPFIGMYTVLAQSLQLPVFPVYLPGLLIMSYENAEVAIAAYGKETSDILFYINPYDKGAFLGHKALDFVVQKKQIPAKDEHYKSLSNKMFIYFYLKYLRDTQVFDKDRDTQEKLDRMLFMLKQEGLD